MAGVLRSNTGALAATGEGASKENAQPKLNRATFGRRSALGNVTNQVRRQPQRAAKGKDNENTSPQKAVKGPSFAIFEDTNEPTTSAQPQKTQESEPMQDQENFSGGDIFQDAVMNLHQITAPRPHLPLAPIDFNLSDAASPMFVDEACSELEAPPSRTDEFGLDPYFQDIYDHLRSTECLRRPHKSYMSRQSDVSTSMRNILVDWLVEVGEEYKLQRETLFLAIAYVDRFLSLVGISRPKLQLVGTTCMFIAAKYEEIYPPDVAEFVYITDNTYTRSQVLKMESAILKILDFRVAVPTINWFVEHFLHLLKMSQKEKHLSYFLIELSLIEVDKFLDFRPSVIASSAIVFTRIALDIQDPWPEQMEQSTGYLLSHLKPCIQLLVSQHNRKEEMPQRAVLEKYKQDKFDEVALVQTPPVLTVF